MESRKSPEAALLLWKNRNTTAIFSTKIFILMSGKPGLFSSSFERMETEDR